MRKLLTSLLLSLALVAGCSHYEGPEIGRVTDKDYNYGYFMLAGKTLIWIPESYYVYVSDGVKGDWVSVYYSTYNNIDIGDCYDTEHNKEVEECSR